MIIGAFEKLEKSSVLSHVSLGKLELKSYTLQDKTLDNCILSHSHFKDVQFKNCTFNLCFMDFSHFENCTFEECKMTLSLLACSKFLDSQFIASDLISVNFNGIHMKGGSFEESDLYYSRYVMAKLEDMRFYDCNLKRVDYSHSLRHNCEFKSCNVQDAYLEST